MKPPPEKAVAPSNWPWPPYIETLQRERDVCSDESVNWDDSSLVVPNIILKIEERGWIQQENVQKD